MTRRTMIRIVSFSLSGLVIAVSFAILGYWKSNFYKIRLENTYQRAFSELTSSVSEIDYILKKGQYATSPSLLSTLASQIYRESASATSSLSQLPFSAIQLDRTTKFITQLGDYSHTLGKRAASHLTLTDRDRKNLVALSKNASTLSQDLNNLIAQVNDNHLTFEELLHAKSKLGKEENKDITMNLSASMQGIEQQFPEYPTLIYDGPFSEHLSQRKAALLEGKPACSADDALQAAKKFIGAKGNTLKVDPKVSGGKLPTYTVSGESISIDVTKMGCQVVEVIDSRKVGPAKLTPVQAIVKAKSFLNSRGFKSLKESYWTKYENTIMVNFAVVQDDILLYPDLVKVTIGLDDGSIINFQSTGYIMNHKARNLQKPKLSKADAQKLVPEGLKLKTTALTLIPTDGEHEVLTYELKCETEDKKHILVYVDANTGEQVRILILIEGENGVLTM